MRIVVTGADGFVGKNLIVRLSERGRDEVRAITRATTAVDRRDALLHADVLVHLAGVNRPKDEHEYEAGNADLTERLCAEIRALDRALPVVFSSSAQAVRDNPYGRSKRAAEQALERYAEETGAPVAVARLWNVFGKWSRPNYNSVVATFCHNIARGLPISIVDPATPLNLMYIDDVVDGMLALVDSLVDHRGFVELAPVHATTVGAVAATIDGFAEGRRTRDIADVGEGLTRALYATYVSFLPPQSFAYALTRHEDARGVFAEIIRTRTSGQFSMFTAHPGVTRGGHYHHTKTEKFLVVRGRARFGFRHVLTGERVDLDVTAEESRVVETVPGWIHDITNTGTEEMIVLLWANEAFDPERPDTIAATVRV